MTFDLMVQMSFDEGTRIYLSKGPKKGLLIVTIKSHSLPHDLVVELPIDGLPELIESLKLFAL